VSELAPGFAKLTPERITAALTAGDLSIAPVAGLTVDPLPIEGAFCDLARLTLTYGEPGRAGPAAVVAKIPKEAAAARQTGTALGLYERERRFYSTLASRVPLRVPTCHHAGDGDLGEDPMLLEDLTHLRGGDQVAGFGLAEAGVIVDGLAALHAAFWESPQVTGADWLSSLDDPMFSAGVVGLVVSGVDAFESRYADRLPPATLAAAAGAARAFAPHLERCRAGPFTLAHFDARSDNWLFDTSGQPVLIDWQTAARIRGTHDIAYVLTTSLATEFQSDHWESLLRRYHAELRRHGVGSYAWDDCLTHYREHVAYASLLSLALLGSAEIGSGRGQALADAVILRGVRHAAEIDAYRLL
jgi:hypothetical protein